MTELVITLFSGADISGFRRGLRRAVAAQIAPENVVWQIKGEESLFAGNCDAVAPPILLPRDVAALIDLVVCHRDPERYALLHKLVWRTMHGERALIEVCTDPLVYRLQRMAKAVRRDLHKMHAFLRFRRTDDEIGERYVAWFEPDHYIVEATAGFFVKRYPSMRWSIVTPVGSLTWDCDRLKITPAGERPDLPTLGMVEDAWDAYFQSTFNPARVNVGQMQKEMPRKYWRNMPETKSVPAMLQSATSRVEQMISEPAQPPIKRNPEKALAAMLDTDVKSLEKLNASISASEPFVKGGTRAVLGEGPLNPLIAFVGEQPGDQEDLQGRPFVGPAGQVFNRALEDAGIKREECYVTNAVKHFKYEQRGKRRLHQKPTMGEIKHYRWWLTKELELVSPKLIVALGGTAAAALSGKAISISRARGAFDFGGRAGFITVHPSYLLRLPDELSRAQAYESFIADLSDARALSQSSEDGHQEA